MTWIRLHVVVEGQTEEAFVRDVLAPELYPHELITEARMVEAGRRGRRVFRGGVLNYSQFRRDVIRWLRQDQHGEVRLTTMVDLFRIPADFPGYDGASRERDPIRRAELLEKRWAEDIADLRFIPYVQVHEFEALVFCDPTKVAVAYPGRKAAGNALRDVRDGFSTPEHIDDGPETAPSKRILQEIPEYDKPTAGPLILRQIGVAELRRQCAHFNQWLTRLETCGRME